MGKKGAVQIIKDIWGTINDRTRVIGVFLSIKNNHLKL